MKKADAPAYDPVFRCANAANGSTEPNLPFFRNAANVGFQIDLEVGEVLCEMSLNIGSLTRGEYQRARKLGNMFSIDFNYTISLIFGAAK